MLSGMYGDIRELGVVNGFLIVVQLLFAGIIVLCLVCSHSHIAALSAHCSLLCSLAHCSLCCV